MTKGEISYCLLMSKFSRQIHKMVFFLQENQSQRWCLKIFAAFLLIFLIQIVNIFLLVIKVFRNTFSA